MSRIINEQSQEEDNLNNKIVNSIIKKYNYALGSKHLGEQRMSYYKGTISHKLGLEKISKELYNLSKGRYKELQGIVAPEKKLVVMIVGNHSAGKSSFINWYLEQNVQKTKVSIETIEMNIIMQGQQPGEFNGINAMQMLPFLKDLYDRESKKEKFPGLLENLFLKSCSSKAKDFRDVIFIDTPGLADGNLEYKFNVEDVMKWFSKHCDLTLVFLDPNSQALCKRTLNLVQDLHNINQQNLHFYMTKGDIFDNDDDRLKCMCQITQGLSTAIPPMHGFTMPIIYIPTLAQVRQAKPAPLNQINEVTELFHKKHQVKAQAILSKFKNDMKTVEDVINKMKQEQQLYKRANRPLEILLEFSEVLLVVGVVLLVTSFIDIFSHDFIEDQYFYIEADKSVVHLLFKILMALAMMVNVITSQLLIHDFNRAICLTAAVFCPILFFITQTVPQKLQLYSVDTVRRLENFHFFIMQTKRKYRVLTARLTDSTFQHVTGRGIFKPSSNLNNLNNDPLGTTSYDESSAVEDSIINRQNTQQTKSQAVFESEEEEEKTYKSTVTRRFFQ